MTSPNTDQVGVDKPKSLKITPILSANWGDPTPWKIESYEKRGGYQALRTALSM